MCHNIVYSIHVLSTYSMPYPLRILFNSHSVPIITIPLLQEEKLEAENIKYLPKATSSE